MSLTAALRTAQNSLAARAAQTAVTSRNIGGADDPTYSRKLTVVTPGLIGGSQLVTVQRATDKALYTKMVDTTSAAAAQAAIVAGLNDLSQTVGDPESDLSPAAKMQALEDALQTYAGAPGNVVLAQSALAAARTLSDGLNQATAAVQAVRQQADADLGASVDRVNTLLAQFDTVNTAIVKGTYAGADVTGQLDQRDALVAQISEEIGVTMSTRAGNDAVLYTDSGVTLFETHARAVAFTDTPGLSAATSGKAVTVDGVPVTGNGAAMPVKSGKIQGLAALRDTIAPTYQAQLDEMARGLVQAFSESDQGAPATNPDAPGLCTWSGAPAMPASGAVTAGLAASIRVNASVDPAQGGNIALLRDGGIADPANPAYRYNPGASASYADRLQGMIAALDADQAFDTSAGLASSAGLSDYASASTGWLEAARQSATGSSSYQSTLLQRTSEALSNATGVNLDDEMATLLDLERSYQASSKLISTVDSMLATLLASIDTTT